MKKFKAICESVGYKLSWLSWSTVEGVNAMILEAMYNGEFYPCETVVPTSPEYRKAVQTCAALMEQLSQRLSKEDYALVEELRAQNAIAQCEESESHFKYGFSAGLIVQQEAYYHTYKAVQKCVSNLLFQSPHHYPPAAAPCDFPALTGQF